MIRGRKTSKAKQGRSLQPIFITTDRKKSLQELSTAVIDRQDKKDQKRQNQNISFISVGLHQQVARGQKNYLQFRERQVKVENEANQWLLSTRISANNKIQPAVQSTLSSINQAHHRSRAADIDTERELAQTRSSAAITPAIRRLCRASITRFTSISIKIDHWDWHTTRENQRQTNARRRDRR